MKRPSGPRKTASLSRSVHHQVTIPDAAVLAAPAPEPASLGLLAQGAAGLVAWRRRDSQEELITARQRTIL